ncbi:thermonuclease family protein [Lutimaribacter saemankumensis]|uniref:Endonuclease YncB, thermonuclease family n=1 Tax=Lutimaribacter saemankumensis TaxID=490829 RepID=A0A1G8L576_9RHOB|nr:thermonuclease family protein [Lutimaribacter saemankumensis]SDI50707.1 Endonuclease YncB, thermonuclease family [Lutimaribacter saemankumensis]
MLRLSAALVLSVLATVTLADPSGTVRVVDGDTLSVGGVTVRLHGIDAPETDQFCGGNGAPSWPCGAWVGNELRARVQGRHATCRAIDTDRYGRVVAKCFVDGKDIGQELVRDGLAFAYRKYSWDYDLDEKSAAVKDRGLHGTGIQSPAAFRRASRAGLAAASDPGAPAGCVIKGNISSKGRRIYHMPGQEWYSRTRINTAKGERWFCSEAEARAAGWRRAAR